MTTTTLPTTTLPTTARIHPARIHPAPIHPGRQSAVPTAAGTVAKGWHPDPMAIHKLRWHDGDEWTSHVTHFGPVPCHHCGR